MKNKTRIICTGTPDETLTVRNIAYVEEKAGVFHHRYIMVKCTKKQFKSIFGNMNYNERIYITFLRKEDRSEKI